MKLRTTIMVASMIALPLAAVIGFRWPKFSAAEKPRSLASRPVEAAKPSAPPTPAWNTPPSAFAKPSGTPSLAEVVPAGGINAVDNPGSQVVQASNTDVHQHEYQLGVGVNSNAGIFSVGLMPEEPEIRPLPSPTEPAAAGDPFTQIQQRLKALGAIHYSLETWGPSGEAYKFQCRMAAGHNPNYSRHFEATDVDPVRVMQTVLSDVEAWKSGRLP